MRKALSLGSKSYPGTVAKARSSGEKSSSILCRLSSFSRSALARFDSAYRKDFSSFTSTRGLAVEGRIQIGFDQGPDLLPVVGLLMVMLAFSSFFSTLGLVMMLIEVKLSPVEAKMDALGIDILSTTFSSGLEGSSGKSPSHPYHHQFFYVDPSTDFPQTLRQERQEAKLRRWSPCLNPHVENSQSRIFISQITFKKDEHKDILLPHGITN